MTAIITLARSGWTRPFIAGGIFLTVLTGSPPASAHSRHSGPLATPALVNRTRQALASRGASAPSVVIPSTTTCRLGLVTDDGVSINAPREQYGRLLARVSKGDSLLVCGETDNYYAVIMIDHSTGLIAKKSVQLLDTQYNVAAASSITTPLGQSLVQSAYGYLGVPYVWGGNTAAGIDCSGFVKAVYAANGMPLPRTAAEQVKLGYNVPMADVSQWQAGDRMYFECHHSYVDHTGMYIGNGYFIHSSTTNHGVNVTRVDDPFFQQHLVAVRRSPELVSAQTARATPAAPDYEADQQ